jgi:hypothetical protein
LNLISQSPLLLWFTTFHLNLMYSCIEEEARPEVIRRCYWPLLNLSKDYGAPLGIEASGLTLQLIQALDPEWIAELRRLIAQGKVELIGSGYAQIIGPLVPAEVNEANLRLGHEVYDQLLDVRPQMAFVNEQAYSSGLVKHYLDAGYRAIVMEWQNPARAHPEWASEWRYLPQLACDQQGNSIALIWNNSIAFQKFQRLAHGEIGEDEYLNYVEEQLAPGTRAFSVYGNDAEIFDFRPGRYGTEPALGKESEWRAIRDLWAKLESDDRFRAVRPSDVLTLMGEAGGGNRLRLESAEEPVPVKKQGKYNLTRWSTTGRDNLGINTRCWRIFRALQKRSRITDTEWQELCYLWSSDFRTHITEGRWRAYQERLSDFVAKVGDETRPRPAPRDFPENRRREPSLAKDQRLLSFEAGRIKLRINQRRGLAIDGLWFRDLSELPLIGTLPHGYYDDISLAADFYSGHLVFEIPGEPKVTDLTAVEPHIETTKHGLDIAAQISTPFGPVNKTLRLFADGSALEIEWRLNWKTHPAGSLRLGHVTLNPAAFPREELFFVTHNGGWHEEIFPLNGSEFDHGAAVSSLVSARGGVGMTGGWLELGGAHHALHVDLDQTAAAPLGMMQYKRVGAGYFCRLSFSVQEMDETRKLAGGEGPADIQAMRIRISAIKGDREWHTVAKHRAKISSAKPAETCRLPPGSGVARCVNEPAKTLVSETAQQRRDNAKER